MSSAKCHNYTGCLLAYRGEVINLPSGAPLVCPECGKPLTPVSGGAGKIVTYALIGVAALAVAGGAYFFLKGKPDPGPSPTPAPAPGPVNPGPDPLPGGNPTPLPVGGNGGGDPKPLSEGGGGTPDAPKVPEKPEFKQNRKVRDDVLARIDQIPNITPAERDQLVLSMDRARSMGMILVMPFGPGRATLTPNETAALRAALERPQIKAVRDNPTAIFVVLGYADSKGDAKANVAVSQQRANAVVAAMRKEANVLNVTHAVGMGGTTLHDAGDLERNRIVEVWAVLP